MNNNHLEKNLYELVFILKEEKEEILNEIKKIVTSLMGKINSEINWGKKSFAYRIKKFDAGFYYLWNLSLEKKNALQLKKKLNLNENVIRYLLLKV